MKELDADLHASIYSENERIIFFHRKFHNSIEKQTT